MNIFKIALLLFSFLLAQTASAFVNMRTGSYTEKWIDIIVPGDGYNLSIERYYSSRSLFIGLFGFGWCSELETQLDMTSQGELIRTDCGGGLSSSYYPEGFDPVSALKTTEKILVAVQAQQRTISRASDNSLKSRLLKDPYERFNMARKFQIVDGKAFLNQKHTYISKKSPLDRIEFTGKVYIHRLDDGRIAKYDQKGRLMQLVDTNGNSVTLKYKGPRLAFLVDNKGRQLVFQYNAAGRLQKIDNGAGLISQYTFAGDDLMEVTNAWRNTYFFKYDRLHNLTQVTFPGGTQINMSYDTKRDWVKNYSDRLNCQDAYDFVASRDKPKDHYWSNVNRICPSGGDSVGKYEFWYQAHKQGSGKYLEHVKTLIDKDMISSKLHPVHGEPLKVATNNSVEVNTYMEELGVRESTLLNAYDSKRRLTQTASYKFDYNKSFRKLVGVNETIKDAATAKHTNSRTAFRYSKSGRLQAAKKSNGELLKIRWNPQGQIVGIESSKGENLKMVYSVDFPKPKEILTKAGRVQISYSPTGQVTGVKSEKGRSIASKVVQTFVNFTETIGPAVEGLEI